MGVLPKETTPNPFIVCMCHTHVIKDSQLSETSVAMRRSIVTKLHLSARHI